MYQKLMTGDVSYSSFGIPLYARFPLIRCISCLGCRSQILANQRPRNAQPDIELTAASAGTAVYIRD